MIPSVTETYGYSLFYRNSQTEMQKPHLFIGRNLQKSKKKKEKKSLTARHNHDHVILIFPQVTIWLFLYDNLGQKGSSQKVKFPHIAFLTFTFFIFEFFIYLKYTKKISHFRECFYYCREEISRFHDTVSPKGNSSKPMRCKIYCKTTTKINQQKYFCTIESVDT